MHHLYSSAAPSASTSMRLKSSTVSSETQRGAAHRSTTIHTPSFGDGLNIMAVCYRESARWPQQQTSLIVVIKRPVGGKGEPGAGRLFMGWPPGGT